MTRVLHVVFPDRRPGARHRRWGDGRAALRAGVDLGRAASSGRSRCCSGSACGAGHRRAGRSAPGRNTLTCCSAAWLRHGRRGAARPRQRRRSSAAAMRAALNHRTRATGLPAAVAALFRQGESEGGAMLSSEFRARRAGHCRRCCSCRHAARRALVACRGDTLWSSPLAQALCRSPDAGRHARCCSARRLARGSVGRR